MKTADLLNLLKKSQKPVLTLGDVTRILGKSENYVKVFLSRAEKRGFLQRIERGKYALPDTSPFVTASNLLFPSYVSFVSALSYYGLTTQIPRTVFVVSLKQKKEVRLKDYTVKFVKLSKNRFFGYRRESIGGYIFFIGEIEKVIVDSLFLPKYCPLSEVLSALESGELCENKLISYVARMQSKAAVKRLGYLMELSGREVYEELKTSIDKKYDLLNPMLPKRGEKNKKWKLIINEVF